MSEVQPDSAETQGLLEQASAGDTSAFERLFTRHQPYLQQLVELRLDPRLRARLDPSDIVQEAHMEAFRRLSAYLEKRPMPFRLWLRQIACDHAAKARRHHLGTARRSLGREAALPEQSSLVFAEKLMALRLNAQPATGPPRADAPAACGPRQTSGGGPRSDPDAAL